jgi:transposase-like protein
MEMAEVIEFFGSQQEVARVLGVNARTVREWGDKIPLRRSYTLRKAMENHAGEFDEVEALHRVRANIEREAARKLKAVDRMISSIKEGQDDE